MVKGPTPGCVPIVYEPSHTDFPARGLLGASAGVAGKRESLPGGNKQTKKHTKTHLFVVRMLLIPGAITRLNRKLRSKRKTETGKLGQAEEAGL